jgi:photosystem II stability/assembly factor-like uncharacterized protein
VPQREWERLGVVPEGHRITAVAASPEGFGLLGAMREPAEGALLGKMKARQARLLRVGAGAVESVWEGPGWVQALDCAGALAVAVLGTLKPAGTGTDYHLLVSTDAGRTWGARGPVVAPSVSQVHAVSELECWVLGAGFLGRTLDGGATWAEVELQGERDPHTERLRRVEGRGALLGRGVFPLSAEGAGGVQLRDVGASRLVDVEGDFLLGLVDGQARVGARQGFEVRWSEPLPPGREPLRLATGEGVLRVLTRSATPTAEAQLLVHVSEDGGGSWVQWPLALGLPVDLAGREWGLGVDAQGGVFGRLA